MRGVAHPTLSEETIRKAAEAMSNAFVIGHVVIFLEKAGVIKRGEELSAEARVRKWLRNEVLSGRYEEVGRASHSKKFVRITDEYRAKKAAEEEFKQRQELARIRMVELLEQFGLMDATDLVHQFGNRLQISFSIEQVETFLNVAEECASNARA